MTFIIELLTMKGKQLVMCAWSIDTFVIIDLMVAENLLEYYFIQFIYFAEK